MIVSKSAVTDGSSLLSSTPGSPPYAIGLRTLPQALHGARPAATQAMCEPRKVGERDYRNTDGQAAQPHVPTSNDQSIVAFGFRHSLARVEPDHRVSCWRIEDPRTDVPRAGGHVASPGK